GAGVLGAALRAQADALGLASRVRFAGYQSGEVLVQWMQALDELWVLGLGNDWSGRSAVQGRAVGARVVGVDEGALRHWVDVVLPEPTPEALEAVALRDDRRSLALPDTRAVAEDVLGLYARAGAVRWATGSSVSSTLGARMECCASWRCLRWRWRRHSSRPECRHERRPRRAAGCSRSGWRACASSRWEACWSAERGRRRWCARSPSD